MIPSMSRLVILILAACCLLPHDCTVTAFVFTPVHRRTAFSPSTKGCCSSRVGALNYAKKKDDDEDQDDVRDGMAEAFRELDALQSLDDDDSNPKPKIEERRSKGFKDVNVDLPDPNKSAATPEAEVELYKKMYQEQQQDESQVYSDLLTDMGGTPPAPAPVPDEEQLELLEAIEKSPQDLDQFMKQALEEALEEAKSKTPEELRKESENALNDEEMMKEIEEVFEKANQELLASIEEIRQEQAALAKASAEQNAQARDELMKENAERLEQAQASMEKMLKKVAEETLEVEKAALELKEAQEALDQENPLLKLKSGGLIKQGALVGFVLFGVRSVGEVLAMGGPNGELHTLPALLQGAIALACGAYFFFL